MKNSKDLLPSDIKMVYQSLLKSGWKPFDVEAYKWFPSALPFTDNGDPTGNTIAEPLVLVVENVSIGCFDVVGMSFYDYDLTANGVNDEDAYDGKAVFFPYENYNSYR